jgi:hypothetical protein
MRLWSIHPKYLDTKGIVALWREALLAKAVLRGKTRGYRHHPQLDRFRFRSPILSINAYLSAVYVEASSRHFSFDRTKIGTMSTGLSISVTSGQLDFEWDHLLTKLASRSPELYQRWSSTGVPECHPLFRVEPGAVETWERP